MFDKIKEIIQHPLTPIGAFFTMGLVDVLLHRMQAFRISFVILCILAVIMVLSILHNFRFYGTGMRYTCLGLCLFTALFMVVENPFTVKQTDSEKYNAQSEYGSSHSNYTGYSYGYSDTDIDYNSNDRFTTTCNRCHGSGKCEDCGGSGKSKFTGTLAGFGCVLCDRTGKCYKCNGKGYITYY